MKKVLTIISIVMILSSLLISYNLYDYMKERNFEVVIIDKKCDSLNSFLIVKPLNEVKDESVNIDGHSFIRNSNVMNDDGSIKDKFIIKKWFKGPKFTIKVNLDTYIISPVSSRMIFKVSYRDIKRDKFRDNLKIYSIIFLIFGIFLFSLAYPKVLK